MTEPTVLVGTWRDGLHAVTGNGRAQELADSPVRALTPDGRGGVLAIVGPHSLGRRSPSGEWGTLAASELELSCCMAVGDVIYVGTDDARLLRLDQSGGTLALVDGFNEVKGRESWFAGSMVVNGQRLGPPLGVRSLSANANGMVLFANVHVGGIPRSADGGVTWQPTVDINSDVHEVRGHPSDPDLIVAASAIGLCISRDAGATWAVEHAGMHAPCCAAVAFSGDEILVSASKDFFSTEGRLYRRPIRPDGMIAAVQDGLPAWLDGIADTHCVATMGATVAVADRGGTLYISQDFGRSWSKSPGTLPSPSSVAIC